MKRIEWKRGDLCSWAGDLYIVLKVSYAGLRVDLLGAAHRTTLPAMMATRPTAVQLCRAQRRLADMAETLTRQRLHVELELVRRAR